MMKKIALFLLLALACVSVKAQRFTDKLDRGLVAVVPKSGSGIFLSWRIQADEYYDVTYNVYRNGVKLNLEPLNVSNYYDASGSASATYTVKAVVKGVEQSIGESAKVLTRRDGGNNTPAYLPIKMKDVVDRNGNVIYSADGSICTWEYTLNDCSMADLDGDGEVEIIVKRINATDAGTKYPNGTDKKLYEYSNKTAYNIFEAYKLDGTRLWWIDCGPNMVSLNSTELNCVAFDWDQDGKAEVLFRGADNMIVHQSDGTSYTIGDASVNTRNDIQNHDNAQYAWTITGKEYLVYLEGATAKKYKVIDFPIEREGADKWPGAIDNDGYGHRSSKFFFGAPYLDGRKPSIFLARGIYGRTKMTCLDVDPSSHSLTERSGWPWECNVKSSPWFGQGYHNYSVADVDGDGCDEIVYGSMVIDNNGKGLSTTGLGHGDAHHVGDLDPYRKGLEIFACNEDSPNMNYRNATTSQIYYRSVGKNDDGRALVGNFSDKFPGCFGRSTNTGMISTVCDEVVTAVGSINSGHLADRIYWDGDLLEEYMYSPGTERECVISKINDYTIMQTSGVKMNNSSKNNPCAQGDILGDWREEVVLRSADNKELRIYTTSDPTEYRIPSLWYDHQYRQAMVWQPCAYNQPPHASFFLGSLEGITQAPPPLTNSGREEITANSTLTTDCNGKKMMFVVPTTDNANFSFTGKISPAELIVNVPTLVSGNDDNNNITYARRSCTISCNDGGDGIEGDTHFVKQGEGLLIMPKKTLSYTGDTEIWGGSVQFHGTLSNSNMWMNRHTSFYGTATIKQITMEYGATLYPSNTATNETTVDYATLNVNTLNMHEGACITIQINTDNPTQHDNIKIGTLNIRKQDWKYGPEHSAPVFNLQGVGSKQLDYGKYLVGTLANVGEGSDLSDIEVVSNAKYNYSGKVVLEGGNIYIVLGEGTATGDVTPHPADATVVGSEANNAAWGDDVHSNPYTLKQGQALHIEFRNYNGTHVDGIAKDIWKNWVLLCKNKSGNTEYFAARSDNWGWGTKWSKTEVNPAREYNSSAFGTEFSQQLDGAWVVMDIKYEDGEVSVRTTATSLEGKVMTDSFRGIMINDEEINFYLKVEGSHIAIDNQRTKIKNLGTYEEYFKLDFEEVSSNNYGFKGNSTFSQESLSNGTHCFHVNQGGGSGDRDAYISFENNRSFVNATDYKFVFDWAFAVSNTNESKTTLMSDKGELFHISTPSYGSSYIYDSKGDLICTLTNDGYKKALPTQNIYHFEIVGSSEGTYLSVSKGSEKLVNKVMLADDLVHLTSLNTIMGKTVSHMLLDDIILYKRNAQEADDGNLDNHNVYNYEESYKLDFEDTSSDAYGFKMEAGDVESKAQVQSTDGSHYFHIYQGDKNDRIIYLPLQNVDEFKNAEDYKLEFDFGAISGNSNKSTVTVKGNNGTLFTINWENSGTIASVLNSEGVELGTFDIDGHVNSATMNASAVPTKWSHFVITANQDGVFLKVTQGKEEYIPEVRVSDEFATITQITNLMGRYYTHIAYDDIVLYKNKPFTLTDTATPQYESGHYNAVKVSRNLFQGFNTFCIPFESTPAELAEDAVAYELTKVTQTGNGAYCLHFCATNRIDANKPYLLYVPNDVPVTSKFTNITLQSAVPYTQNVDGWQFVGNYTPNFNTSGKYLLADSNTFKLGGSSSYVNGMRAYLVAPANSSNIRFVSATFDDADYIRTIEVETEEKIYNVNGVLLTSPQQGINIIKKSNGDVIKVLVK